MGVAVARDRRVGVDAYGVGMASTHKRVMVVVTGAMVVGVAVGGTVAWLSVALWMVVGCYCGVRMRE